MNELKDFLLLTAFCVASSGVIAIADDTDPPSTTATPSAAIPRALETLEDAAFDVYVDPCQLGSAWDSADAERMTDVALQLAAGERILLRERRGISAREAFEVAVRIAAERQHTASLERIARYASEAKDQVLLERIASVRKLAASSRDAAPRLQIAPRAVSVHAFGRVSDCFGSLRRARIAADKKRLEAIEKSMPKIPKCCRPEMTKLLAASRLSIANTQPLDGRLIKTLDAFAIRSRLVSATGTTANHEAADSSTEASSTEASAGFDRLAGTSRVWGIKDLDPTNKNSGLRESAARIDEVRRRQMESMAGGRFTITLRNPTRGPVFYKLNGETKIGLLAGQQVTHRGVGKAEIEFGSGNGGIRSYALSSGRSYKFAWVYHRPLGAEGGQHLLNLFND